MSRYHAKSARLYMSTTGTGDAAPVAAIREFNLEMDTDKVDVTAFGDTNKQSVQGFPARRGTFSGFWVDTEDTLWTAQASANGVKLYFYPSVNAITKYWYGPAWVAASLAAAVDGAVGIAGTWEANGDWGRQ